MQRYLGSKITAYAAVVLPLFICTPLLFGFSMLCVEISAASIFLALACVACTVLCGLFLKDVYFQLYSWGIFNHDGIQVKTAFSKTRTIAYKSCKSCGIGFYTHGILNSNAGTKVFFIFFSCETFDEAYRSNMNLWKPSLTRIKVGFSKKLFNYLIEVLPPKQSLALCRDYEKYVMNL